MVTVAVAVQGVEVGSVWRVGHCMWVQKTAGIARTKRGIRRWNRRAVYIQAGILLLPFRSSVLEPFEDKNSKSVISLDCLF